MSATSKIISNINALPNNQTIVIAIDGYSASGKSTLAYELSKVLDANVFHMDDFFKKPDLSRLEPFAQYGANIDYKRLKAEVISPIQQQRSVFYQSMNHQNHQLEDSIEIKYKHINIIEGAFSLHPNIYEIYDYKIFMKTSYLSQIKRIFQRNGFKKLRLFIKKWIPNEMRYFKDLAIELKADEIIKT